MSANNWRMCPKCIQAMKAKKQRLLDAAREAYGKVPSEEYATMLAEGNDLCESDLEETLREDYEIGIAKDGKFYVGYRGSCEQCDLDYRYKFEEAAI